MGRRSVQSPARWVLLALVAGSVLATATSALTAGRVGAVQGSGGRPAGDAGSVAYPPVPPGTYRPPVARRVVDPFRLPEGTYRAGNRGLEYATVPGDPVVAVGAGRVAFAGAVGGRLVVSIDHPDGRRSTLTNLASLAVRRGDVVARGTPVGTALAGLHLGLREGRRYVDPAPFLAPAARRAVLVPLRPG